MRLVTYSFFASNSGGPKPDVERAVLPTIMFARKRDGIAVATALSLGWWKWGIGVIRTVVDDARS